MEARTHPREILSSLGDPSRFRVVMELLRGERCVSDLARSVELSQSCTTRHLQALERVGIVRSHRAGKKVMAGISREPRVAALLSWALAGEDSGSRASASPRLARPKEPAGHAAAIDVDSAADTHPSDLLETHRSQARPSEPDRPVAGPLQPDSREADAVEDDSSDAETGPARPRADMEDFLL